MLYININLYRRINALRGKGNEAKLFVKNTLKGFDSLKKLL